MGSFDDLIPGGSSQGGSGAFDDLVPKKSSLARRVLGDTGVSLLKGAVAVPEAAVGLGNIVSGGLAGKYAEQAGFRPKEAKAMLDEMYSPEQKAANQYVQEGDGFLDTIKRGIERPSVIGQSVVESLPLLLPGAAAARGIGAATKVAPYIAGAAGEGLVGAGSAAEQLRQGSEDGTISGKQTLGALASGVGTAGFGALGGKVASSAIGKKLGISDIDTVLAGGASNPANVGIAKRALSGAVSEGVLEELPQSMWEQAAQNYATDKPLGEGVGQAGAMGLLAGTAMGGTFNAMQRGEQRKVIDDAKPAAEETTPAALGLTYQPGPAMHVFPDGTTMTGAEYQQHQDNQEKARLDGMIQPIPATPEQVKALGYMPGTPLVVFPDGTAMTRAEYEQDRANKEQGRLDSMIQPVDPEPKLKETGPMSSAVNVGVDSGATSLRPQGSFSNMSEFANLLGEEQQDVQSRRTGIAGRQALQREVALRDADQRVADQMAKEAAQRRRAVLDQVLSDPTTKNPADRFAAELQRQGFRNSTPTADELATVQRFNDIKAAQPAGPEIEPSLPNELDAEQLGIRSRKGSSGAQSSGRDKVAEVRQLVADGWKISNKTLVSPTGKKRILNTAEHAAAKEATRERNLAAMERYRQSKGKGTPVSTTNVANEETNAPEIKQLAPQASQANDAQVEAQPGPAPQAESVEQPKPLEASSNQAVVQSDVEDYGKRIVRRNKRAETNDAPVVEVKESRGPSPISKRDDLVGAIMRVTGGNGVAASMSQTITGDTANRASKVRGLFTNNGTMDLDDIANDLRTEEGYDVKDGNHLAELIREQAAGNPVYSMERNERDAAANEEKKQKDAVLKQANELGLKGVGGKRTLAVVEAEIAKEEARLNQLEKEAERKAIQAADAIDSAIGADMTEADFMRWLSDDIANTYTQEEIKRAEQDQADRADAKAKASAIADAEERAQSNSRQGNGNKQAAPQGGRVEEGARSTEGITPEQKIRSAFDSGTSSIGVAKPITVEHNGIKRQFMARQDALARGKNIASLHLVAIHQGRMVSGDEKSWIAQGYKLNGKNILSEEGLPKKITDEEARKFNANFDTNGFNLTKQTNQQAAEQFAQQNAPESDKVSKEQADRERDAVPFSMQQQSQPKPQGRQTGLFTADGRVSSEAKQSKPDQISDFGEKLGGAKKDRVPSFEKTLSDDDIATLPLSKIWPASEIDGVENKFAAAVSYAARNEIPAKPRVSYKVASWVEKVKMLRSLASKIVGIGEDKARELFDKTIQSSDFKSKIRLMEAIDRVQWSRIGKVGEYPNAYRYGEGGEKIISPSVIVEIDGKTQRFEGAKSISDAMDRINAALSGDAEAKKMQFEVRGRTGAFSINKKGDKEYRKLKTFSTTKEAFDFIKSNYNDLVSAWDGVKETDNVTKTDVRNSENRPRTGKDRRNGKDVTDKQFQDAFGFRGVEFGNWVQQGANAKERQGMLNQAFDAMHDLAEIVGIPPKAISLNGTLGLGFGSRGSGSASAHFEPGNLVINLTKTRGAGTLAHEWFHALDNYFARSRNNGNQKTMAEVGNSQDEYRRQNFITYKPERLYVHKTQRSTPTLRADLERLRAANPNSGYFKEENWQADPRHPEGVRIEVESAFSDLVNALNESPMARRARMIDKGPNGYWSRIIERGARSFENYVISKMMEGGYNNDYLANVREVQDFPRSKERYPYLLPEEVAPISEAFDTLFSTIQTKETDKGVAMFSFAGRSAATADQFALSNAEKRIEAGDDAEEVRKETGWFKGADGKWRFEIDDSDAKPTDKWGALLDKSSKYARQYGYSLSQVLDHPALFAAYPELKSFRVYADSSIGAGTKGTLSIEDGRIRINNSMAGSDLFSTLLHEIQHGIQSIEGFASGGSELTSAAMYAQQKIKPRLDAINKEIIELGKERQSLKGDSYAENVRKHKSLVAERSNLEDELQNLSSNAAPKYRIYARMAGEVEARNVQSRQSMTAEQRRERSPSSTQDVSDSDVIVVFNGKVMQDAPMPANASRGQGSGMAFRDLQAVVDRVSKGFNNLPKIHVLDSPKDLSDRRDNERTLKEQIEQAGAMDDVEGAHHNGEIYLFASGIASEERAEHVLATHEITHYGLRGTMGKGLDSALQNIWLHNKEIRAKATVLRTQLGLSSNVSAVEEVLAEMKDSDLVKLKGWRKMVQAFRDWVHKAGFDRIAAKLDGLITKGMSDQEKADLFVANMVNAARDWVRNGKPARGYDPGTSMLGDANFSAKSDTIKVDGVDRPTTNSNGKPIAQTKEGLRNFWRWFGDSKVVDSDGRPRVVYHGTTANIEAFDLSRSGEFGERFADAAFFTSNPEIAAGYAQRLDSEHNRLMSIEDELRSAYGKAVLKQFAETKTTSGKLTEEIKRQYDAAVVARQSRRKALFTNKLPTSGANIIPVYLRANNPVETDALGGFFFKTHKQAFAKAEQESADSVIVSNVIDRSNEFADGTGDVFAVFSPSQIKSATGNNGNFDASNPDIRFSRNKSASVDASITEIFDGLAGRGLKKVRAEERLAEHPQAESIRYVQDNILDILEELEGAGTIKINC